MEMFGRLQSERRQTPMGQNTVKILLAEELGLVREGLAALCQSWPGFSVVGQCADGEEALRLMQSLQPQITVLDLQLPKLFALEVIRRARQAGADTRFIVLSTRLDRKTVIETLRTGASAYVLKAGPARHLREALEQVGSGSIYVSPLLAMDKIFAPQHGKREDPLEALSAREYQVFSLLVDGLRAKEIAGRLDLSPKTVDTYRASLMRKLDIHDVAGLVKFAIQRNLTSVSTVAS